MIAIRIARVLVLVAALGATSACTNTVGFRADYLAPTNASVRAPGSGAVAMSPGVEQAISDVKPSSFTGGATTLRLPVGKIAKEAALAVFGATLEGGVISVSDVAGPSGKSYLIEPTVTAFSYKYDQLSNLGFAVTPRVDVSVQMRIRDNSGGFILDRVYQKSHAQGTYLASVQPHERVNRTLHQAVQMIMTEAARDFAAAVAARSPPSS